MTTQEGPREANDGYEIVEGAGFLRSVEAVVGDVQRWDEIRSALDWELNRDPTNPEFAEQVAGTLWITTLEGPPEVAVLYEISERGRLVTYWAVVEGL